ncbi:hypothetical protein FRC07_002902, partial [Ceratobasidium sp. 392]
MPRRPRVLCACKCGQYVTTAKESDHLQKKYYAKSKGVSSIVRKRQPSTHPDATRAATESEQQLQELPSRSESLEPIPGPSGTPSRARNTSQLWDRVLATRAMEPDEESASERSENLFGDDFQSQYDSDNEAQPQHDPGAPLNPITHGIPPGELLRQDMLVRGVVNETFDFIIKHKVSVATYSTMQDRFVLKRSHSSLSSLQHLRTRILALSGLKP